MRAGGDQSNSIAFLNDRYVLKIYRRIEPGINPDFEIGRYLVEHGFTRTPVVHGALEYNRPSLEPGTLGVVQAQVKHQGSGWEYSINDLRRYFERVVARVGRSESRETAAAPVNHPDPPPFFEALEHWYLASATTLGRRTAEMHLTLASSDDPAFVPEPLDATALRTVADEMRGHAEEMFATLERRLGTLNDAARAQAEEVLAGRAAIAAEFDALAHLDGAGLRTRVHGDYHLGQVLRTEEDFVILDFEGEPARTLVERRAKHSPLKDVAGMVRSFSYAAYAALFAFTTHAPAEFGALDAWADTWQHFATESFLQGYRAAIGDSPIVPPGDRWQALLRAFVLDKALYELGYELNSRPDWVRIPLTGIQRLAARLQS